jgi:replicative DNA helicase
MFSLEALQAVLGGLLLDDNAVDRINGLEPAHFYREDHRLVYSQILQLVVANRPADVVTVFDALQGQGRADRAGGLGYLTELAHRTPSAANIARYAEIVRDRAMLRETLATAQKMRELVETPGPLKGAEILDRVQAKLAQVGVRKEAKLLRELMAEFCDSVDARAHGSGEMAIPTRLDSLDTALNGGLRRGNLVIVAGRPSMGKTALTTDIGLNMSTDYGVLLLSMEMSDQAIVARAVASRPVTSR